MSGHDAMRECICSEFSAQRSRIFLYQFINI